MIHPSVSERSLSAPMGVDMMMMMMVRNLGLEKQVHFPR